MRRILSAGCFSFSMIAGAAWPFGGTAPDFSQCVIASGLPTSQPGNPASIGPLGVMFAPETGLTLVTSSLSPDEVFTVATPVPLVCTTTTTRTVLRATTGLIFKAMTRGIDGRLYVAVNNTLAFPNTFGEVYEISPVTGATVRVVVTNVDQFNAALLGTATDPATGDVWFSNANTGIYRITNPAGSASLSRVINVADTDGLAWSCDGSRLYAAGHGAGQVLAYDRNATLVDTFTLPAGTGPDGVAFGVPGTPTENLVYVNCNDGTVKEINPSTRAVRDIAFGGTRGDFLTVDVSGNLYVSQSEEIVRLSSTRGRSGGFSLSGANFCSTAACAGGALASTGCANAGISGSVQTRIQQLCDALASGDLNAARRIRDGLVAFVTQHSGSGICSDGANLLLAALNQIQI